LDNSLADKPHSCRWETPAIQWQRLVIVRALYASRVVNRFNTNSANIGALSVLLLRGFRKKMGNKKHQL